MAFLDNSGDIILDAVLTDAGRRRLARGDGSFKISKYAFGDDEINYAEYDATNASGSAYYDLEILQTPILEAFTNNIASLKSKLITITNNNLLYLPVIEINKLITESGDSPSDGVAPGAFPVLVDNDTVTTFGYGASADVGNYLNGFQPNNNKGKLIRLDQGLDTDEISSAFNLDPELTETQYIVELDNRFGNIVSTAGTPVNPSFIDDDNIASYYISTGPFVSNLPADNVNGVGDSNEQVIAGPRGTKLEFKILSSVNLRTSTFLFTQLGSESDWEGAEYYYIDTTVRVQGATTGYRVDIPVRYIKHKES